MYSPTAPRTPTLMAFVRPKLRGMRMKRALGNSDSTSVLPSVEPLSTTRISSFSRSSDFSSDAIARRSRSARLCETTSAEMRIRLGTSCGSCGSSTGCGEIRSVFGLLGSRTCGIMSASGYHGRDKSAGNTCVPQLFGANLGGNTGAERQRCRSVTQIVKPDARQFGALENDLKVPLHEIPFIQRVAARIHEDQIRRHDIALERVALPLASAEVCLRIPQRAMDRLVDVFALPRFRIPAHEDAHQPGALTSRNDLSGLACHSATPRSDFGAQLAHIPQSYA